MWRPKPGRGLAVELAATLLIVGAAAVLVHVGTLSTGTHAGAAWSKNPRTVAVGACVTQEWTASDGTTLIVSGDGPFIGSAPTTTVSGASHSDAAVVALAPSSKGSMSASPSCGSVVQDAIAVGMSPAMAERVFGNLGETANNP